MQFFAKSLFVLSMALTSVSQAAPSLEGSASAPTIVEGSNRMRFRQGVYLSILSEPMGFLGANYGYNATDFLRLNAGLGALAAQDRFSNMRFGFSVGGGAKLVIPNLDVTPYVGLNTSMVFSPFQTGNVTALGVGVEFTAPNGFYIGAGITPLVMTIAGASGQQDFSDDNGGVHVGLGILPHLNIGTFF
ncbi:hypothetical protein K2X33_02185 [bacterium]|nr:hypothetical protein [bacterium]